MSRNKEFKSFEIYEVSEKYINYLREYDNKVEKSNGSCYLKKRKYLSIALAYGKNYLIPFSSPKDNDYINGEPRRSNTTIISITTSETASPSKVIGKLKTSSMIPVKDMSEIKVYDVTQENYRQYSDLINEQVAFIEANSALIENYANKIYYEKINNFDKDYIKNTVDFKKLEVAANEFHSLKKIK